MRGSTSGNGDPCITHPEHGKSQVLSSGRQWCANQSHDGKPSPRKKGAQPKIVGKSSPWLDEQKQEEATA